MPGSPSRRSVKRFGPEHELPHDEERPALAHEVERSGQPQYCPYVRSEAASPLRHEKSTLAFPAWRLAWPAQPKEGDDEMSTVGDGRPSTGTTTCRAIRPRPAGSTASPRLGDRDLEAGRDGSPDDQGRGTSARRPDRHIGGAPPHWLGHVAVDDVDEAAARAEAAGGTIVAPAMDIPEAADGRRGRPAGRSPVALHLGVG